MELLTQIIQIAQKDQLTGIRRIDTEIADAKGWSRMATEEELAQLYTAHEEAA